MTEIAGYGLEAYIGGKQILAGNYRLMDKYGIAYPEGLHEMPESLILCACNGIYAGVVVMEDELKDDAVEAIRGLKQQGIRHFEILSGIRPHWYKTLHTVWISGMLMAIYYRPIRWPAFRS